VFSYDSTGILEQLSRNFPTVAFWDGGLGHLIEEAKPYYKQLVDAKIIFFSPEEAAQHVNSIWEDIDSWWLGSEVQSAREQFVFRYARKDARPSKTLSQIIRSIV
jgi:putative transferase (TIGR04331 family)